MHIFKDSHLHMKHKMYVLSLSKKGSMILAPLCIIIPSRGIYIPEITAISLICFRESLPDSSYIAKPGYSPIQ